MSVHIHRSVKVGWTQISNEILRMPEMSFRARGVLVTLLSHEDGWQQSMAYTLTEGSEGRDAVRAAFDELVGLGYMVRLRVQTSEGHWRTETHVYDEPILVGTQASGLPTTGKPTVGSPGVGRSGRKKKNPNEESLEEPRTSKTPPVADTFDQDKWKFNLQRLHEGGWTGSGQGALTWGFLMKMRKEYGSRVVDSALSDARYNEVPPSFSSAAYFQAICERFAEIARTG